jgi:hypothetical protein
MRISTAASEKYSIIKWILIKNIMMKIFLLTILTLSCVLASDKPSKDIGPLDLSKIPSLEKSGPKLRKSAEMSLAPKSMNMDLPKELSSNLKDPESFLESLKKLKTRSKKGPKRKKRRGKMMNEKQLWRSVAKKLRKSDLRRQFNASGQSKPKKLVPARRRCPSLYSPCYCKPWDWCCIWRSIRRMIWYLYQLHWWFTWQYGCFWGKIFTLRYLWRLLWRCPWWLRKWLWNLLRHIIWNWYCW